MCHLLLLGEMEWKSKKVMYQEETNGSVTSIFDEIKLCEVEESHLRLSFTCLVQVLSKWCHNLKNKILTNDKQYLEMPSAINVIIILFFWFCHSFPSDPVDQVKACKVKQVFIKVNHFLSPGVPWVCTKEASYAKQPGKSASPWV